MNYWLKFFSVLAYIALLVMCCVMFFRSLTFEPRMPLMSDYRVSLIVSDSDSVLSANSRKELDSLVTMINKKDKEQYAEGINDVRQETNNIINKINGWLSFWLAILALVGGIIPYFISWRQEKDYKDKYDEEKEKINHKLSDVDYRWENLKSQIQNRIDSSQNEIKKMQEQIKELIGQLELREANLNITNLVNSFIAARDNKLIKESLDRDILQAAILKELSAEFDHVLEYIFPDNYTSANKIVLEMILIQYHSLFTRLRVSVLKCNKSKEVENTMKQLKEAIETIAQDTCNIYEVQKIMKEVRNGINSSYCLFYN